MKRRPASARVVGESYVFENIARVVFKFEWLKCVKNFMYLIYKYKHICIRIYIYVYVALWTKDGKRKRCTRLSVFIFVVLSYGSWHLSRVHQRQLESLITPFTIK